MNANDADGRISCVDPRQTPGGMSPEDGRADTAAIPGPPVSARGWRAAIAISVGMLVPVSWLLARALWLPFFFGLFFYLIAGLLVPAITFRWARSARPISRGRLACGVAVVALGGTVSSVIWEYRHVAATAGDHPRFLAARARAVDEGQSPAIVRGRAEEAFHEHIAHAYAPGGVIGYVRWAVAGGHSKLTVMGSADTISIGEHGGWVWPVRTVAAALLLTAGAWCCYGSLRSERAVSNVLAPGEEYEELDE